MAASYQFVVVEADFPLSKKNVCIAKLQVFHSIFLETDFTARLLSKNLRFLTVGFL
jgi:hypothetical protein